MRIRSPFKKGVSLVTVLIFMMVATIAATATYKWLSTVGFTSADRMAIAEAKESSRAGLEAVRSWMTYHANDVGAIIRQYFDNNKNPVKLDDVIHMNSDKQKASVWLMGVEAKDYTYKFTITSTGYSRTDAKYSETSVLAVRGLYKVKEPVKFTHKALDYHYSYFGGSVKTGQGVTSESMLINGNWGITATESDGSNPGHVLKDFVVTGSAKLSGNNIVLGEDGENYGIALGQNSCIGGDFEIGNDGATMQNVYVHGKAKSMKATITGNAYFNDDVIVSSTGDTKGLNVTNGDVTINKKLKLDNQRSYTFSRNLCMSKDGVIDATGLKEGSFTVSGGAKFLNGDYLEGVTSENYTYTKLTLGGSGKKLYTAGTKTSCNGGTCTFDSENAFTTSAQKINNDAEVVCDTSILEYCQGILGKASAGQGCDGEDFKIDDMLTTAYSEFTNAKYLKTECSNATSFDKFSMTTLNGCYDNAAKSQLFHGFLVVKLNDGLLDAIAKDENGQVGKLAGKFIFYLPDGETYAQNKNLLFPGMEDGSAAFVYLGGNVQSVNSVNDESNPGEHRYFFYSKGNIGSLMSQSPDKKWTGSFFMSTKGVGGKCARINELTMGDMELEYDDDLVQLLLDSTVICGISEEGSCGVSTSVPPEYDTGAEDNVEGFDIHYVATAPQLSVLLESQRRDNSFKEPENSTVIKPSVVILPRVVYLDPKPKGTLHDYFSVVNLNGANENRVAAKTQCPGLLTGAADNALLADETSSLTPNIYRCTYQAEKEYGVGGNDGEYYFWVVVDGDIDGTTKVHFKTEASRVIAGGEVPVNVDLVAEGSSPVTVTIDVTETPYDWTATPQGLTKVDDRTYTVTMNPGETKTIFKVSAGESAVKSMMFFTIESAGNNGIITAPYVHTVSLTGEGRIRRVDIPSDCGVESIVAENSETELTCAQIAARDDCVGSLLKGIEDEWIHPNCNKPFVVEPNNLWECEFGTIPEVKLVKGNNLSEYCELFILPGESIQNPVDGEEYSLHASYKAKMRTITVKLDSKKSRVQTRISKNLLTDEEWESVDPQICKFDDAEETCTYLVPSGYHMSFFGDATGGEFFIEWRVTGVKDPIVSNPFNLTVGADTVITAVFREKSDHCFERTFDNTGVWCEDKKNKADPNDCIDKCDVAKSNGDDENAQCYTRGGGTGSSNGSLPSSYWVIPRTNSGQNFCPPQLKDGFLNYTTPSGNSCSDFDGTGNGKKNAESGNATISYLLSRAEAGHNGKMTSVFKTCFDDKIMNSGFILRSPANVGTKQKDWYTIYNILGDSETNGKYKMKVKKCYGDGTGIKNESTCNNYYLKDVKSSSDFTVPKNNFANTLFTATIEAVGGVTEVIVSYETNGVVHTGSVTIRGAEDEKNGDWEKKEGSSKESSDLYVGASMAANCFKIHSIKWDSYDWGSCSGSDDRQVSCSFSANYLGGMVPVAEKASPWVGTSTWFKDPENPYKLKDGCSISYHYNGCDVDPNIARYSSCEVWEDGKRHCSQCSADKEGPYYVSGKTALEIKNKEYIFTYSGMHGVETKSYQYSGETYEGTVRDASVVVDCGENEVYEATCGSFNVGTMSECLQNFEFIVRDCQDPKTGCTAYAANSFVNLRSSSIIGEIAGLPENSDEIPVVIMVLKDAAGNLSQQIRLTENGYFWIDVNLYSDNFGFDPERVTAIMFSGSNEFSLKSLRSECSNSIGVYSCSANYDGQAIVISTNMQNPQKATCKVTGEGNDYKVAESPCPTNGVFEIPATLQSDVNASGDDSRDYVFTVTMISKDNQELTETCTTPVMTKNSNVMKCQFSNGLDNINVIPGDELPSLTYTITNCPTGGCQVSAKLNSSDAKQLNYTGGVGEWAPMGKVESGENYTYELSYLNKTCRATLNVLTPSGESLASHCRITNEGFAADLNLEKTSDLKIAVFSALGQEITASDIMKPGVSASTKLLSEHLPSITTAGTYTASLFVDDVNVCSFGSFTVAGPSTPTLPEDLGCSINGEYFETSVSNNTGSNIEVKLYCGTGLISEGNWENNTKVSINAYASSHTECPTYILARNTTTVPEPLCSVNNPFSTGPSGPSTEPTATCEIYKDGAAYDGTIYIGESYQFVAHIVNQSKANVTMNGPDAPTAGGLDGDVSVDFTPNSTDPITYSVMYTRRNLCTKTVAPQQPPQQEKPKITCGFFDSKGTGPMNNGSAGGSYKFVATSSNNKDVSISCSGTRTNKGGQQAQEMKVEGTNEASVNPPSNTKCAEFTCTAKLTGADDCVGIFTW